MKKVCIIQATTLVIMIFAAGGAVRAAAEAAEESSQEGYRIFPDARISMVQGDFQVQGTSDVDTQPALVNQIVTTGDRLLSYEDGQAEVQFDRYNFLRVWRLTKADVKRLEKADQKLFVSLFLMTGSIDVYSWGDDNGQKVLFEVNTPSATVRVTNTADVRIDVDRTGITTVKAFEGGAEVLGGNRSVMLSHKEMITATPNGELPVATAIDFKDKDEFDSWLWDRNHAITRTTPSIAPAAGEELNSGANTMGEEDLNGNGNWVESNEYGRVWQPRVWDGWSPYYYGVWRWAPSYGYYWVSWEPWGWYPFHYGWWSWEDMLGWFWIPGNFWGPAWVWWFNDYDNVGWIPRHPHDHFNHRDWDGHRPGNDMHRGIQAVVSARLSRLQTGDSHFYEKTTLNGIGANLQPARRAADIPVMKTLEKINRSVSFMPADARQTDRPAWLHEAAVSNLTRQRRQLNRQATEFEPRATSNSNLTERNGNNPPPAISRSSPSGRIPQRPQRPIGNATLQGTNPQTPQRPLGNAPQQGANPQPVSPYSRPSVQQPPQQGTNPQPVSPYGRPPIQQPPQQPDHQPRNVPNNSGNDRYIAPRSAPQSSPEPREGSSLRESRRTEFKPNLPSHKNLNLSNLAKVKPWKGNLFQALAKLPKKNLLEKLLGGR